MKTESPFALPLPVVAAAAAAAAGDELISLPHSGPPYPLGYFVKPSPAFIDAMSKNSVMQAKGGVPRAAKIHQFVFISDDGKKLRVETWPDLVEPLSFLNEEVEIVGSSNGFLLCCTNRMENMRYIICNPVTKQFQVLPEPHKFYCCVALAFTCQGDAMSLDGIDYQIIRAGVSNPRQFTTELVLETFSSLTGEWKESSLVSAEPFLLRVCNMPATVIGGVIYFLAFPVNLLAYDCSNECIKLIKYPRDGENDFKCSSFIYGKSGGRVHFARCDTENLEIWVMDGNERPDWILKHRVSILEMRQRNPDICGVWLKRNSVGLRGFDPHYSERILLTLHQKPFWYDLGTRELHETGGFIWHSMPCDYFLYEWPSASSEDE